MDQDYLSEAYLLWNIALSVIGMAYLIYARAQRRAIPLISGLILLVLPYLTDKGYLLFGGLALVVAASYFLSKYTTSTRF